MKLRHLFFIITVLVFISSCKKEASRDQPYKDALMGSWRISEFFTNYDSSISYVGYNLIFTADGKVQATDTNSISASGTWFEYSYEWLDEYYLKLELPESCYYLNGSWTFLSHSPTRIDFDIHSFGTVYTMTLLKN